MDRQARVFERAVGSVVKISTGEGGGTGFVTRGDGLILTAAHVVGGARVVRACGPDGREFPCRVVRSRRYEDVAALAASPKAAPVKRRALCLSGCSSEELAVGLRAIAIGNPSSCSDFTFSNGYISAPIGGGRRATPPLLQINMSVNWGNSGGPVILLDGKVCGMAVQINYATNGQRNEGVAHAVPASFLKTFVESVPNLRTGLDGSAYCGVCGNLVPDERHCGRCGVELAPIEDEERAVARIFGCGTCGSELEAEQRFCGHCGTDNKRERSVSWASRSSSRARRF
ncbi:MAG TPA: trypsin-like peptidase domain-containing protein [Candidatus Sulfomarinibacteraceae bacterium]|nr:trypsin-like peptidase domain-containing protein [Candidatus Sulfomarinibacteraceae bacterium]